MMELPENPIHPGEVLIEVYMKPFASPVTVNELAESMNVPPMELIMFMAGKRSVTTSLAARLAMRFKTTTQYWLGLQSVYDQQSRLSLIARAPGHFTRWA